MKLKILIAGKFKPTGHNPIGGLQSWIKTVTNELERLGHDVDVLEPHELNDNNYDLGIFSNIDLTRKAVQYCSKSILISHGIIEAEKPDNSCDKLYFVSEGGRDYWKMDGGIIRQPIDLEFWKPGDNTQNLVSRYSYRTGNTFCKQMASNFNREYCHINGVTHEQARALIQNSLVVFATGRAALESMACGVPTVIYDHREAYQPALMDLDLYRQKENSYSGRGGKTPTQKEVLESVNNAVQLDGWRDWIKTHHDVKNIVRQLLND